MRRYLLDTGIAADFIFHRRGVDATAKVRNDRGDRIGICYPVLGELWTGIELSATKERNRRLLKRRLTSLVLWPYDEPAAVEFGRIHAALRRAGRPMQQIDMQIAAVVKSMGNCTLVTKDSDFQAIPGLKIENWAAQA